MTSRNALRRLTLPAAIAYVTVTVLTLLMRAVTWAFALLAEVAERLADAGDTARTVARGERPVPRVWMSPNTHLDDQTCTCGRGQR